MVGIALQLLIVINNAINSVKLVMIPPNVQVYQIYIIDLNYNYIIITVLYYLNLRL